MTHSLTRRGFLAASVGAAQLALLDRFSSLAGGGTARAQVGPDGPTKLLVLYLPGGLRFHEQFVPLSDADIDRTIPPNANPNQEPVYFGPEDLHTFTGDSGGFQPLRMSRRWNPSDPADRSGYAYTPLGYSWVHHDLGATTAAIHGVNAGSVAHQAAQVGAMCGLAGSTYRAPALVSLVANHLHQRFGDVRPIPCVSIRGSGRGGVPQGAGLPSEAWPTVIPDQATLTELFSADPARLRRWASSNERASRTLPAVGPSGPYPDAQLTSVDEAVMRRAASFAAGATPANRDILAGLYGSYAAVSKTLAQDVVSAVESVTPTTLARPAFLAPYHSDYGATFGLANGGLEMTDSCEWILRLLKSNVTSAVYANLPQHEYDSHGTNTDLGHAYARAQLDIIARLLGEMKATPSPDDANRTLYDDTVVLIQSEFNRSWAMGPTRASSDGWNQGDDHNDHGSVILSGGAVAGNRQVGGFDIDAMRHLIAPGLPVSIREESGDTSERPPNIADVVATVANLFGMEPNEDFFIPGGYGVIEGLRPA